MFRIFKITNAEPKKPGEDLVGLLVVQTAEGFYVVAPEFDPPRILTRSDLFKMSGQGPLVKFDFHHKKRDWGLDVDAISDIDMSGTWNGPADPAQAPDTWVASGTGTAENGDDEARAASAK